MHGLEKHKSDLTFSAADGNQTIEVIHADAVGIIAARQISVTSKGNWTVDAVLNYVNNTLSVYMDHSMSESAESFRAC